MIIKGVLCLMLIGIPVGIVKTSMEPPVPHSVPGYVAWPAMAFEVRSECRQGIFDSKSSDCTNAQIAVRQILAGRLRAHRIDLSAGG